MNAKVLFAVFKRNFVSYFASPTGYLFICVFVLLSTVAAFWPDDFFNTNLANLNQLSFSPANPLGSFPFIMLVFIPAITMGIWADERRQGTDELLLTIPASDLDIVLGKYLAAVAIFSVSLLFSLFCNGRVLAFLGDPDLGLFVATYVGYWLVGLAMLAIGMMASFLTPNLTIAYILGAALNAPLVFVVFADNIVGGSVATALKHWSVSEQFRDFGRGILSLSGLVYFGMLGAVMLYLSMVLIGRRHWRGGQGTLSNQVFYPLLHLGWLGSFVTFWVLLKDRFDPTNLAIVLSVLYLLLHTGLLCGWSLLSDRAKARPWDAVVALIHLAVIVAFVAFVLFWKPYTENKYLLVGALIVYLVIQAALVFGWLVFAGHAALLPGQYTVRALALVLIGVAALVFLRAQPAFNLRADVTSERLSVLSPYTHELLKNLELKRPVKIEAFISPEVPESYVQTRLDLRSRLEELAAYGGEKVTLTIHDAERFSEEAALAEDRYGITPREVTIMERGTVSRDFLFLGVAFTSGLEKVVIPFMDRGIPVEYELVRSLATVTEQERRKLGVLDTDAQLYGRFDMQSMSSSPNWPLVEELEKQYEVQRVDATNPITEEYDVLLAVQPSSLGPEQMDNFLDAVRNGVPTVIFEDPLPFWLGYVPGTLDERRPPGGMNPMMGRQPPMPKGNFAQLLSLLQIDFSDVRDSQETPFVPGAPRVAQIVWQDFNPLPRYGDLFKEYVFVAEGCGAKEPFNEDDEITSGLQHLMFPFPGSIRKLNVSELNFTPLVRTGNRTGTVGTDEIFEFSMFGRRQLNASPRLTQTNISYVLAAHITGRVAEDPSAKDNESNGQNGEDDGNGSAPEGSNPGKSRINVVMVADIDVLHGDFFRMRERGMLPEMGVYLDFDNVTFVLNALDVLAGDDRFVEIRKRRPKHRTLTRIDESTEEARKDTQKAIEDLRKKYQETKDETEQALNDEVAKLQEDMKEEGRVSLIEVANRIRMFELDRQKQNEAKLEQMQQETESEVKRIETKLRRETRKLQNKYKTWAVVLPPIPPLALALIVFFTRRTRERRGVARSRLRS